MNLFTTFKNDEKENKVLKDLRKANKLFRKYQWKFEVSGVDKLEEKFESMMKEVKPSKVKLNRNQLPLILRSHSSEINELYHLYLTLKEFPEVDQTFEQIVINRSSYVLEQILEDIRRNEEVMSGEYIPAN